ncbi:DJ-1/PfpI family protein [Brevibacterium luteolum]|uniref:DJ-1/PfpI family protein n=1 Tax=Brevibacterium luteolum TaxID=199591 RepID=UPI0030B81F21
MDQGRHQARHVERREGELIWPRIWRARGGRRRLGGRPRRPAASGGTVNPDQLRVDRDSVSFVCGVVRSGRQVAAICHGPWTLIEAGVAAGRTLTSFPNIRTDLCNTGADVVDQDVVVDKNLITSRSPEDLPAFSEAIVSQLAGTTTKEEEKL